MQTRAFGRSRLRELALDAAREGVVLDRGWSAVRMGAIATAIPGQPPSVRGFGTKDDLGRDLVIRETAIFFDEMRDRLNRHPGVCPMRCRPRLPILEGDRRQSLRQPSLTRAPVDSGTSLLPLLTTRGEPLMTQAVQMVQDWVSEQWPGLPDGDVRLMAESVARIGFSRIVTPTAATADIATRSRWWHAGAWDFPDRTRKRPGLARGSLDHPEVGDATTGRQLMAPAPAAGNRSPTGPYRAAGRYRVSGCSP